MWPRQCIHSLIHSFINVILPQIRPAALLYWKINLNQDLFFFSFPACGTNGWLETETDDSLLGWVFGSAVWSNNADDRYTNQARQGRHVDVTASCRMMMMTLTAFPNELISHEGSMVFNKSNNLVQFSVSERRQIVIWRQVRIDHRESKSTKHFYLPYVHQLSPKRFTAPLRLKSLDMLFLHVQVGSTCI